MHCILDGGLVPDQDRVMGDNVFVSLLHRADDRLAEWRRLRVE